MAEHVVKVPDVGEGVAEVELVAWLVEPDEQVKRNQVVAEVMTDKANIEVPAPADGVIANLAAAVGETLLVGSELFSMTSKASETKKKPKTNSVSNISKPDQPKAGNTPTDQAKPSPMVALVQPGEEPSSTKPANQTTQEPAQGTMQGTAQAKPGKFRATPPVRKRAKDLGLDLSNVVGSGANGRITHDDLDQLLSIGETPPDKQNSTGSTSATSSQTVATRGNTNDVLESEDEPLIGVRRQIATRLQESSSTIPHITYVEEVDMTTLERLRKKLNEDTAESADSEAARLTILPFLVMAVVKATEVWPQFNAHVDDETNVLRKFSSVHVGIATQTEKGLMVPVLRNAETETVSGCAQRIAVLAGQTRSGKAAPTDLTGSTITISSLGVLGGITTTPIINKPETTIIGVNRMVTRPVWQNNQFVPRKMMNLSSSFDHRVIDGYDAALFVQHIRQTLENPALLFLR